MSIRIDQINNYQPLKPKNSTTKQNVSFHKLLNNELINTQLKISKHAQERLSQRKITLSDDEWSSIERRIGEARQKGVNDSLVLVSQAALIINAKNNTVITAMDREEAKAQIFTNINGTIIM
ncbi:MAG: TIGR02530 family flagellar biosynthesis protein [Bacillota bacterium]